MDFSYLQEFLSVKPSSAEGEGSASASGQICTFGSNNNSTTEAVSADREREIMQGGGSMVSSKISSNRRQDNVEDDPTFGQSNFDIDLGDGSDPEPSNLAISITRSLSSLADRIRAAKEKYVRRSNEADPPEIQKANSDTPSTSDSSASEDEDVENPIKRKPSGPVFFNFFDVDEEVSVEERNDDNKSRDIMAKHLLKESHFQWFAHGYFWTIVGILFSWTGFALAMLARRSNTFVTLETPMYIDPVFDTVEHVGLVNLQLCFNETYVDDPALTGCTTHRLDSTDINDSMFQISRILVSLVILLGGFMSAFLTTTLLWSSINLRPIGIGYLFSYFLQSFTFLFFDTNLCAQYTCHVSTGCYYSILASICWIVACVAASRMDVYKLDQQEMKQAMLRRLRRKIRRSGTSGTSIDEYGDLYLSRSSDDRVRSESRSASPQKRQSPRNEPERQSSRSTSERSKSSQKRRRSTSLTRTYRSEGDVHPRKSLEYIDGIQDEVAQGAWNARRETNRAKKGASRSASLERTRASSTTREKSNVHGRSPSRNSSSRASAAVNPSRVRVSTEHRCKSGGENTLSPHLYDI